MDNQEIIEAPAEHAEELSEFSDEEEKPKKSALKKDSTVKKSVKIAVSESESEGNGPSLFVNPLSSKSFLEDKKEPKKTVDEDGYEWSSDEEEEDGKVKRRRDRKSGKFEKDQFEEVPKQTFNSDEEGSRLDGEDFDGMDSDEVAETRALAKRMLRKKDREGIIDSSYNRFSNMDPVDALPEWFLADESRHYRPNIPITKEEYMEEKKALDEWNARPIKKVA